MESSSEIEIDHSSHDGGNFPNVRPHQTLLRNRSTTIRDNIEDGFVLLETPENEIEEKKMEQNYMFGFKKWKAHVTERPFAERSEAVKSLYITKWNTITSFRATILPGNIVYSILIGWWVALVYLFVAMVMAVTIIGWPYAKFCWKLAWYFFWPFGKYVTEASRYELEQGSLKENEDDVTLDTARIIQSEGSNVVECENSEIEIGDDSSMSMAQSPETSNLRYLKKVAKENIWRRPATYLWLLLGGPILLLVHSTIIILTGLAIIFIPISKLYLTSLKKLFLLPPEKMSIRNTFSSSKKKKPLEIILCCFQAVNVYFYKFTVDGMSILVTNMLTIVLITLCFGYGDPHYQYMKPISKFVLGVISIIPLAHYIGFAITSISSQSRHVVGAFLNALFGSFIEIFIYVSTLLKQKDHKEGGPCYSAVVKSALTGSLLVTMLFIPGICMVLGGIKHKEQAVNVRSASVSSTLLFISVAGVFTPTIFATTYGGYMCWNCNFNGPDASSINSYSCEHCSYTVTNSTDGSDFYKERIQPLVISISVLLPLAYAIGLVYSLFTHASILEEHFKDKHGNINMSQSGQHSSHHSDQHSKPDVIWGRLKSIIILLICTVAMALCAEIAVQSLQEILESEDTKITETFIGVTVIAVVPEIPEIINGVQFALKNNINLSLEIGSSIAVQICLLQIPALVALDFIFDLNFRLLFNDLHLWSVILSVIIMNYTFVDGKSDYFQGSMLCIVYFILLVMFFYAPESTYCRN